MKDEERYKKCFREGELLGLKIVRERMEEMLVKVNFSFKDKEKPVEHVVEFSGYIAGIAATLLLHGHHGLEHTLQSIEAPEKAAENSDRWIQMVMNTVADSMVKLSIPVELRFMIQRTGKEKP